MALREVHIPIRFTAGVETKEDHKAVPETKLLRAENAVFTKRNTLIKRNGYDVLSGTATYDNSGTVAQEQVAEGTKLARRGTELVQFTPERIYSYHDDLAKWTRAGDIASIAVDHRAVAKTTGNQTLADRASVGGVEAYAWEDSNGGVWYAVADEATGKLFQRPTQFGASHTKPRVVAVGTQLVVCAATTGRVDSLVVNSATPTQSSGVDVMISDLASPNTYEFAENSTGVVVAWSAVGPLIRLAYVTGGGKLGGPGGGFPAATSDAVTGDAFPATLVGPAVTCDPTDGDIGLAWVDTTSDVVYGRIYTSAFASVLAATDLSMTSAAKIGVTAAFDTSETLHVFAEHSAAAARDRIVRNTTLTKAGATGTELTTRGVALASQAFGSGDRVYVALVHDVTYFSTYAVVRDDAYIAARILPDLAYGAPTKAHLPAVNSLVIPLVYNVQVGTKDNPIFTESGIRRVALDFDSVDVFESAEAGRTLYVGGGMVQQYDGGKVAELGFHYAPDDVAAPTLASGGSLTNSGAYSYVFAPFSTNAQGEIDWGPTSVPIAVTMGGGDSRCTFAIPTVRLTAKSDAGIAVFRSLNGDASVYYRVSSEDPAATGSNGYVANDASADSVSFVDDMGDAVAELRDPLYTSGGVSPNDPTPTGQILIEGKGRLWANDAGDPHVVRYTKSKRDLETPGFSPELSIRFPETGGSIKGIGVLDDALVVFKERGIYYIAGPGPVASPSLGGGFSEPIEIPSDVGCTSHRSIGQTPVGLIFQADKGIHLLGRDRQVQYIGAPVERWNSQTVVSTEIVEERTQIRMLTDAGVTLVYDYRRNEWAWFTRHEGKDAIVVGGVYHYLRNNGEVYKENTSSHADAGNAIRMSLETAWVKFAGNLQGFQRLRRALILGEFKSAHTLRLRVAYDYEEGWEDTFLLSPSDFINTEDYGEGDYGSQTYGGTLPVSRYQFDVHLGRECEAVKFLFEDIQATGDAGASFELTELLLTGGVKKRSYVMANERLN